jgi:hypothetical protein
MFRFAPESGLSSDILVAGSGLPCDPPTAHATQWKNNITHLAHALAASSLALLTGINLATPQSLSRELNDDQVANAQTAAATEPATATALSERL